NLASPPRRPDCSSTPHVASGARWPSCSGGRGHNAAIIYWPSPRCLRRDRRRMPGELGCPCRSRADVFGTHGATGGAIGMSGVPRAGKSSRTIDRQRVSLERLAVRGGITSEQLIAVTEKDTLGLLDHMITQTSHVIDKFGSFAGVSL